MKMAANWTRQSLLSLSHCAPFCEPYNELFYNVILKYLIKFIRICIHLSWFKKIYGVCTTGLGRHEKEGPKFTRSYPKLRRRRGCTSPENAPEMGKLLGWLIRSIPFRDWSQIWMASSFQPTINERLQSSAIRPCLNNLDFWESLLLLIWNFATRVWLNFKVILSLEIFTAGPHLFIHLFSLFRISYWLSIM